MSEGRADSLDGVFADPEPSVESNKRTMVLKVWVSDAEKTKIDRQKGRLSFSAFLRDRGLNRDQVYDPTYAAIGGTYQAARNLRDSSTLLSEAHRKLDQLACEAQRLDVQAGGEETNRVCTEILDLGEKLLRQGLNLANQADEIGRQARELGQNHLQEMLARYPEQVLKPRKRK